MKLEEMRRRETGHRRAEFDAAFNRFVKAIVTEATAASKAEGYTDEDLEHAIADQALNDTLGLNDRLLDAVRTQVAKTKDVQRGWDSLLSDIQREQSRMW